MIVRKVPQLKMNASCLANRDGKNLSEVIRDLLESYVKKRDIGAYIDQLWKRIGDKIAEKGFTEDDIDSIIQDVRKNK